MIYPISNRLSRGEFKSGVQSLPLISVDLLVVNDRNELLMGMRKNEPAKGYWFVPGGRILKNEPLSRAFARLTQDELGKVFRLEDCSFAGVFEHFYDVDFSGDSQASTHYIVLAYIIRVDAEFSSNSFSQHESYQWSGFGDSLKNSNIHDYTKAYCLLLND